MQDFENTLLVINVIDQGIGITEDQMIKLF